MSNTQSSNPTTPTSPSSSDVNKFINVPDADESSKVFETDYLTTMAHADPDLHWIGEGLPAPSTVDGVSAGQANDEGTSVFPARADHTHDNKLLWGQFNNASGFTSCPVGNTFLSTMGFYTGTNMLLAGGQTIQFPTAGLYLINCLVRSDRAGGGNYAGAINLAFSYNNGGGGRVPYRNIVTGIPTFMWISAQDFITVLVGGAGQNVSFQYQHSDTVAHNAYVYLASVVRLSSL